MTALQRHRLPKLIARLWRHDAAGQGIAEALRHLDDTIRQIRDSAFTTRGQERYPAPRNGAG